MQDFKKLKVWEKAHELTLDIYKISNNFPKEEIYALTSQIRRASASIGLNIAEGCGRVTIPDFKHFLVMAMGSINEVEYCLILAFDFSFRLTIYQTQYVYGNSTKNRRSKENAYNFYE